MAQSSLAGVAYISVDGITYRLNANAKYNPSTVKRETLTGMDGVHGFKETPVASYISGTFRDAGDLTVAAFNAMTDVTVTLELANGKVVTARNAWTTDVQEVDAAEGTFDVRFESPQVEEQ